MSSQGQFSSVRSIAGGQRSSHTWFEQSCLWCHLVPSDHPRPTCWVRGVLTGLGGAAGGWRCHQRVLELWPAVLCRAASVKGDITRPVFVLVVECWTEEISARPEEGAQEDHHGVCEGGCPPEESRERLEAESEERKPNRGPRKCQNPGGSSSERCRKQRAGGDLPLLLCKSVKKGNEFCFQSQLSSTSIIFFPCVYPQPAV